MQARRVPLPVAVAVLSLGLAIGPACNSTNQTSSTTSGSGGSGSGASGGNTSGGSPSGGAVNGTSTGQPPQDPIGTTCSTMGNGEYQSCSTSTDCACPLLCGLDPTRGVDDAGGSICVHKCSSTDDCPEIFTSCQNGLCTMNICEADGGGGAFMGPCNAAGINDGTCEPTVSHYDEVFGACIQAGTVALDGGNCDPNQQDYACAMGPCSLVPLPLGIENLARPKASTLCPVGYQCVGTGQNTGYCQQLCDPNFDMLSDDDAGGCLDGKSCLTLQSDTVSGGYCGLQGDGGCTVGAGGGELGECGATMACECPLECTLDLGSIRRGCEVPCAQTLPGDGGCDLNYTSCQRGIYGQYTCNWNYCVQNFNEVPLTAEADAGKYAYSEACNYAGTGDGTCQLYISFEGNTPIGPYGLCQPTGNVPLNGQCGETALCARGGICVAPGGNATCQQICEPLLDGGCPGGDGCFSVVPFPLGFITPQQSLALQVAGFCAACSPATTPCINSSECCDGFCDFALPDAGNGFCN